MSSDTESSGHTTKGILKAKHELNVNLGAYNLYVKRASFKDDGVLQQFITEMAGQPAITPPVLEKVVPILTHDEDSVELSEEELAKRKEFERKRKRMAAPEGLDIKAILGHRASLPGDELDEEDDDDDDNEEEEEEEEEEAKEKGDSKGGSREAEASQKETDPGTRAAGSVDEERREPPQRSTDEEEVK